MTIQVSPLKGADSLAALNVFSNLLFFYRAFDEKNPTKTIEEYYANFLHISDEDKEIILRKALFLVALDVNELYSVLKFTRDGNGASIGRSNINNLSPSEIIDRVVAVMLEIGKININLVGESLKKKLETIH